MWRHSIGVAVGAEILAKEGVRGMHGDAFTAGLLHDVGKIVCDGFVGVQWSQFVHASARGGSFDAAERKVLSVDHAQVGAEILAHWGLPDVLVDAVRWHHRPLGVTHRGSQPLVDVVHMADAVVQMIGWSDGREGLDYEYSEEVAKRLDINDRRLERLIARVIDGAEELLEVIGTA
jgi:putative nucleotidyltransferase with HDIG domain